MARSKKVNYSKTLAAKFSSQDFNWILDQAERNRCTASTILRNALCALQEKQARLALLEY